MVAVDIDTGNLRELARVISENLRANGFPAEGAANRQVLALAEECGEFVGAYRRWSGQARRTGTAGEMSAELADVVITAFVAAEVLDVDLERALAEKANVVLTRGWREQAPAE
jgi:NTP pyrophosphatase (non-canonical NTP hydrolase)